MRCYLLYNAGTEGERRMREIERQLTGEDSCEMIDADSPRGIDLATTHDVLARPAILLTRSDGSLVEAWTQVESFPPAGELRYRMTSG